MKKAFLSLFLIICMLLTLVACTDPEENPDGTPYDPNNPGTTQAGTTGGTGGGPQLGDQDPNDGPFGPIIPAV